MTTQQMSLSTAAARTLATTTKSQPQMQEITSRWLLRLLPWENTPGGAYRVTRRRTYTIGDRLITFTSVDGAFQVIPAELAELPVLVGFTDGEVLAELAQRCVQQDYAPGEVIVERDAPIDRVLMIAHGKARQIIIGQYGEQAVASVVGEGEYLGATALWLEDNLWDRSVVAATACTVLTLDRRDFDEVMRGSAALISHVSAFQEESQYIRNKYGETAVDIEAGHSGEPDLPGTFVDYDVHPREYELSVVQTILRIHSRVADLYSDPMDQTEEQLRLTIEALRERQEHEMINNSDFGLLHNVDRRQRLLTHNGAPTPDDLDDLLSRRRSTSFFLAHPRAIAAFGHQCSRRGIYPHAVEFGGHRFPAWRDVPILNCNKIPISDTGTTSVIAVRAGREGGGVIGLHKVGLVDEYEPGLSIRFMGINEKAIISYLVTAYFSVAVLVPDALGVLEGVQLGEESG